MGEYKAFLAYIGVALVVFVGGLLWNKYRVTIKRRLDIEEYRTSQEKKDHPSALSGHSA